MKAEARLPSDYKHIGYRSPLDSSSRRDARKSSTSGESDTSFHQPSRRRLKQTGHHAQKSKRESGTFMQPPGRIQAHRSKVREIEESLCQTLKSIISFPADFEPMLEGALEEIRELQEMIESLENSDFSEFYQSKIGQYLIVIQKVVRETFGHLEVAKKVDEAVIKLLQVSCRELMNQVEIFDVVLCGQRG